MKTMLFLLVCVLVSVPAFAKQNIVRIQNGAVIEGDDNANQTITRTPNGVIITQHAGNGTQTLHVETKGGTTVVSTSQQNSNVVAADLQANATVEKTTETKTIEPFSLDWFAIAFSTPPECFYAWSTLLIFLLVIIQVERIVRLRSRQKALHNGRNS